MKNSVARFALGLGVGVAVLAPLASTAVAVVVAPSAPRAGKLVQVGPLAEAGFPAWYRDSNNVRLEACMTPDDPLCPTPAGSIPNPDLPVSFPGNFSDEFFYQLAGTTLTLSNGVKATISLNLEGAFANGDPAEGDQMVFGRVRIRFAAPEGDRFRITHPYGIDDLTATNKGIFATEDTGAVAGAFGLALGGRVGPFLKWDPAVAPAAPAGYIGDPGVNHKIVGSPYNTNFVRIEKFDPVTGGWTTIGSTDLFSLQGRYATNAGVDVDQATYSTNSDGSGMLEVFATSEPGQAIEVVGNPALGFRSTRLRGANGHYYGRFPVTSMPSGASVEVINSSDRPVAHKTRKIVDVVKINDVAYDADAQALRVTASSSDRSGSPVLTATGFGRLDGSAFTGVTAPPATITVTSAAGGSATANLTGTGHLFTPAAPVAAATADTPAIVGQTVRLDGTGSAGEIDSYAWTQTAGAPVTVSNASSALATFVPTQPGAYVFTLAVAGPGGAGTPMSVTVDVTAAAPPKANAGLDQTVVAGSAVALDASKSIAAESYSWRQVSGPAVTLTGANTARPTFVFPAQALPAAPGPNPAFVFTTDAVVLELTVRNPAGINVSTVTVRPAADVLSGITARYRTGNNEWRITGTSSLIAGQRVEAVLGSTLTGKVIGTPIAEDAAGAFSIRVTGPSPAGVTTISLVTTTGGRALAVPVQVTN